MRYVLGVFVLLVVALAVSRLVGDRRRAPRLRPTRGTVVAKRFTGRSGTGNERAFAQYQVDVRFSTERGEQVDGTALGRYRARVALDPGEPIDVWYDSSDPGSFQLIAPGSLLGAWPFVLVLALITAVALAVVLL